VKFSNLLCLRLHGLFLPLRSLRTAAEFAEKSRNRRRHFEISNPVLASVRLGATSHRLGV